ncbi:LB_137 family protein [Leptospira idonii]|uniref:LB_137 family protein n=1 Tax=Leptospira idonii TaxID=1193500 RepID=UPI001FE7B0E6|nr:hypothetical protein [Leptospira idonii]
MIRIAYKLFIRFFQRESLYLLLFLYVSMELNADRLKLKSGEQRIGRALTVTTTHLEWQEEGKTRKIPLNEILGIEVGYDGIPVCADYSSFGKENCDLLLFRLTKTSASFVKKDSPLELEVVPISKINTLRIEWDASQTELKRFVQPGTKGFWKTEIYTGNAILKSNENDVWILQTEEGEKKEISLSLSQIQHFEIKAKPKLTQTLITESPRLIPGYAPIQEKKYLKATLLFGGAFLSALGMAYEYNQSVQAINNDQEFIPGPDGRIYIVSNVLSTDRYDFHNQRFQIYTGVFTAIIAYSLFDSFYLGQVESKNGNTGSVRIKPNIRSYASLPGRQGQGNVNSDSMNMNYGLEIETRF